jgi:hypothetical protein
MPKKPAPERMPSWRIHRIRKTPAAFIGIVEAPDEDAAIQAAIREFRIKDSDEQKRLVATRRD